MNHLCPWQKHRILNCYVNYCFPHKAQLFHPTQVSKLILAVFLYILHFPICTATCSVGFLPIASVSWSLLLLINKFMFEPSWNGSESHQCSFAPVKTSTIGLCILVQSQLSSVNSEWAQGRATNSPETPLALSNFRETQWVGMTIINYSGDTVTCQKQRQVEMKSNKKSKVQGT